jgi:hypothetical protein
LGKYTFEPYYEDGGPRRFAGTFRPPITEVDAATFCMRCGLTYVYVGQKGKCWENGHFDTPLYEADE